MILPDDMVSRMHDNVRRRQAEYAKEDAAEARRNRRHVLAVVLAAIAVSIVLFWILTLVSQAS